MFLVQLSKAVYGSKRQSSNFREYTHTDQFKVFLKNIYKKKKNGTVLWTLISGHVMQVLCWNELQSHKSRAEVHWTFGSWCIAGLLDQTPLLILFIRETLKYIGKSFVQKKQWQKLQGSWVSGKCKLYLRTVFGCSCYMADNLWDRRLKKQMPFTFVLVDWRGGNQAAKLMLWCGDSTWWHGRFQCWGFCVTVIMTSF